MSRSSNVVFAFLIGAAAGAVTALLLAPANGSETRRKIRKGIDDLSSAAKDEARGMGETAERNVGAIKEAAVEALSTYRREMEKGS